MSIKIAIANRKGSYSDQWINYCKENNVPYKCVDPYATDIVEQVGDCDAFIWHHHHGNYKDVLFAKQLLFSLEQAGKVVFPDFRTGWHFDDKVGQKYLFEALGIQAAPSWVFYNEESAYRWIETATFPKVFKLRGGAGSSNVMLAHNAREARHLVKRAFGRGFAQFRGWDYIKDRYKLYKSHAIGLWDFTRSFAHLFIPSKFSKYIGPEKGYAYFQEFIPNEGFDYRMEISDDKIIAWVRQCREGDFRASGGHMNSASPSLIPPEVIDFAYECYDKLDVQSVALDIVRDRDTKQFCLIEISYCYGPDDDEFDHGYWTRDGVHHKEAFNGIHWMIKEVIRKVINNQKDKDKRSTP